MHKANRYAHMLTEVIFGVRAHRILLSGFYCSFFKCVYLCVCVLLLESGRLIYVIIKQELYNRENTLHKYYVSTEKIHNIKIQINTRAVLKSAILSPLIRTQE